jgi:hypothetical protein
VQTAYAAIVTSQVQLINILCIEDAELGEVPPLGRWGEVFGDDVVAGIVPQRRHRHTLMPPTVREVPTAEALLAGAWGGPRSAAAERGAHQSASVARGRRHGRGGFDFSSARGWVRTFSASRACSEAAIDALVTASRR